MADSNYNLMVRLLNLEDQNLPPFKDKRARRVKSTQKIINMINNCVRTKPDLPLNLFSLDKQDPEWDDDIIYPKIHYLTHFLRVAGVGAFMGFYAYNYQVFTFNTRFHLVRYLFPLVSAGFLLSAYRSYSTEIAKVRLFDEFVNIRAQELISQNNYLLDHEDIKRYVWWGEDLKETLLRVHRQANNHCDSDFKDSELLLQDFLRRYTNANQEFPLEKESGSVILN